METSHFRITLEAPFNIEPKKPEDELPPYPKIIEQPPQK